MNEKCAEFFINKLNLHRHPVENGYMSEIRYQSKVMLSTDKGAKSIGDSVQFLYEKNDFAPWHRMITSDEIWIHQHGGTMIVYTIDEKQRKLVRRTLKPYENLIIDAGIWFAAEPSNETDFCLFAVFLCPGFNLDDCEFAKSDLLSLIDDENDRIQATKFLQKL